MNRNRARPLAAYALVTLVCAAVLTQGMQTQALTAVAGGQDSPGSATLAASSTQLGTVFDTKAPAAPTATPTPVVVPVVTTKIITVAVRSRAQRPVVVRKQPSVRARPRVHVRRADQIESARTRRHESRHQKYWHHKSWNHEFRHHAAHHSDHGGQGQQGQDS